MADKLLNIRELRKAAGMTLDDLSAKIGVSRQALGSWEKGSTTPTEEYITKLCKVFGVTRDELVEEKEDFQAKYYALLEEYNRCLKEIAQIRHDEAKKNRPDNQDAA